METFAFTAQREHSGFPSKYAQLNENLLIFILKRKYLWQNL